MTRLLLEDFRKNRRSYQHGSVKNPSLLIILVCGFILLVAVLAWLAVARVKVQIQTEVGDALQIVLQTTHESLNIWVKSNEI